MGNIKNKWVKAGAEFNYPEGVRIMASEAIPTDSILAFNGLAGVTARVCLADAVAFGSLPPGRQNPHGRLLLARHAIPAEGYGVAVPWKIIRGVDTGAGVVGGDPGSTGDLWLVGGSGATQGGAGAIVRIDSVAGAAIGAAGVPRPIARTLQPSSGVGKLDGAILMADTTPL